MCGSALEDGVVPTEVRERNAADGAQVLSTVETDDLQAPPISYPLVAKICGATGRDVSECPQLPL